MVQEIDNSYFENPKKNIVNYIKENEIKFIIKDIDGVNEEIINNANNNIISAHLNPIELENFYQSADNKNRFIKVSANKKTSDISLFFKSDTDLTTYWLFYNYLITNNKTFKVEMQLLNQKIIFDVVSIFSLGGLNYVPKNNNTANFAITLSFDAFEVV